MTREYQTTAEIKKLIEKNFPIYWVKAFGIVNSGEVVAPNGMRISKNNSNEIKKLKEKLKEWETEITKYRDEFINLFDLEFFDEDNDERYEYQEFKEIFAKRLWTVRGALNSTDPDLQTYQSKFHHTTGVEIFNAVREILIASDHYMKHTAGKVNLKRIASIDQLQLDFLDQDEMFLPGIIGLGIRSELLHRLYPSHFAIMTRRSGWAMYYLTQECEEFVIDEEFDGKHRTSFYWEYEYDRFSFYSNFICNLLEENLSKHGISLNPNLRFGYVNLFLNEIFQKHKDQAEFLSKWKLVRA
jgi:hypothetical protein